MPESPPVPYQSASVPMAYPSVAFKMIESGFAPQSPSESRFQAAPELAHSTGVGSADSTPAAPAAENKTDAASESKAEPPKPAPKKPLFRNPFRRASFSCSSPESLEWRELGRELGLQLPDDSDPLGALSGMTAPIASAEGSDPDHWQIGDDTSAAEENAEDGSGQVFQLVPFVDPVEIESLTKSA
jgi:hypothetical protein